MFNKIVCFFKNHKPHNHYRILHSPIECYDNIYEGLPCERCGKILHIKLKDLDPNSIPFFIEGPNGELIALTGNENTINAIQKREK